MSEYTVSVISDLARQLTNERYGWIEGFIACWLDFNRCTINEVKLVVRPRYEGNIITTEYTIERIKGL